MLASNPYVHQSAPLFITFEGGEGVGKSTQINLLSQHLRVLGIHAVVTREPGGTPEGEAIRSELLSGRFKGWGAAAEALKFAEARLHHMHQVILPALAEDRWVLCDRFFDSTRAYQGDSAVEPHLSSLEFLATNGRAPDLTFILDQPAEISLARARARRSHEEPDRFEAEDLAFHQALRMRFLAIADANPGRCCVINVEGRSAEQVGQAVQKIILARLKAIAR
jgi:dTMP kinase